MSLPTLAGPRVTLRPGGRADAVISPGNTGALVAGSLKLRRLEGIERPALAARMPSRTGDFILIDAGANPVCEPVHLAQFAVMGSVYAREILGQRKPRVGVLSNGSEVSKGNDLTRENIMKQAASIHDLKLPMLLPGITISTTAENFAAIKQMQLVKFDGETWKPFGEVLFGSGS